MSAAEGLASSLVQSTPAATHAVYALAQQFGVRMEVGNPFELAVNAFRTKDPFMLQQIAILERISMRHEPVLIMGPTGTGKELLAQALGKARNGPFIAINCAAMPETLLESELFGHEKGAFTGAAIEHAGLIEQAKEGTMFFDEVGELPATCQAKLLRVIQERTIRRVGGSTNTPIACRFVCATKENLTELVQARKFREDLYYRLAVFELQTTALTERMCDVDLLAAEFDWDTEIDGPIPPEALAGNVRSLKTWITRKQVLKDLPVISR